MPNDDDGPTAPDSGPIDLLQRAIADRDLAITQLKIRDDQIRKLMIELERLKPAEEQILQLRLQLEEMQREREK